LANTKNNARIHSNPVDYRQGFLRLNRQASGRSLRILLVLTDLFDQRDTGATIMDKKAKKRIEVLRKRTEKLRQQLAGAKSQTDDPDEVANIEKEIADVKAEIEQLKKS